MSKINLSVTRPRDYAKAPGKLALHNLTVKYKSYGGSQHSEQRTRPSELVREKLDLPIPYRDGKARLKPRITERHNFFNLAYRAASSVPESEPLFQPFPPQITFSGYKAFQKYHAILQLRNNDKVVRRVMVVPFVSEILTVQPYSYPDLEKQTVYDELGTSRVACGMEFSVIVNWCPENENDFESEVVVITEREKFVVPVICHGLRGVLEIADEIHFPPTPVHFIHKKNVMLQNPGTRSVSYHLRAFLELENGTKEQGTFSVKPSNGKLEPGEFIELCLEFKSTSIGTYEGELELTYEDTGEVVYSRLIGTGIELDVGLSTDSLTMKPTFIRTSSKLSIFFTNYSTEVALFQFERFFTHYEEVEYAHGNSLSAFDWVRQAAQTDDLNFQEDQDAPPQEKLFTIFPAHGELWPGNRLEVIITFSPRKARRYFTIAYCTISGRQDRLRLKLDGLGVGPLAQFTPTKVDLKDLSLYSEYKFDVNLLNTGELEALFQLDTDRSSNPGTIFQFNPETGSIPVNAAQSIRVTLFCNERGDFEEHFKWIITESVNFAPLLFRGYIGNPSVLVDPTTINFGLVSFEFDCFREFRITNNSNVTLHFQIKLDEVEVYMNCPIHDQMKRVKVPSDCDLHGPDSYFSISPATPAVPAKETMVIVVKFTPLEERAFEGFISIHLDEINELISKVNFEAECKTPKVTLPVSEVDFEESYLRYEYRKPLELLNESQVPAKYKLLPLDYDALQQGNAYARPREGIVEAFSLHSIDLLFLAYRLGMIEFSLFICISGKEPVHLEVKIKADGIGARLKFVVFRGDEMIPSDENLVVEFGRVKVLQAHTILIEIENVSLIPAIFQITMEKAVSPFGVDLDHATLLPEEQLRLKVTSYLNETLKFKDLIKITMEGRDYQIPCSASGFGPLLVCEDFDTGAIHFGDVLSYKILSRTLTVQNKGERLRSVTWTCSDPKCEKVIFLVNPPKLELPPEASGSFILSGTSTVAVKVEELVTCTGTVAAPFAKTKDEPEVHNILVDAEVAQVALAFSPGLLNFVQINGPGHAELEKTVQTLACQNVFKRELRGYLEVKLPFRLSKENFRLQPMESMNVEVILDWQQPRDKLSYSFSSKIVAHYEETSRKDSVPLTADIHFPNLCIQANKIEFGCVIENTCKRVQMDIRNISLLEVRYCWAFIDKHGADINTTSFVLQENDGFKIPTNQIFDILPIRGSLKPGEKERVEFSYFSFPKYKCRALALCEVEGGPSYSVVLDAESSAIKYQVNRYRLDFGVQHFIHTLTSKMLCLTNSGGVPFNYEIDMSTIKRKGMLQIDPLRGHILSTERQKFRMTAYAGIPDKFVEHFKLRVEYFHPHELEVHIEGTYPSLTLDIQRVRSHEFLTFVESAWTEVRESKVKGLMYPTKDSSVESAGERSTAADTYNAMTTVTKPAMVPYPLPSTTRQIGIQRHPSACVVSTAQILGCGHASDDVSDGQNESGGRFGAVQVARFPTPGPGGGEGGGIAHSNGDEGGSEMSDKNKTPEQLALEKVVKEAEEAARREEELKPTVEEVDVEIDRLRILQYFYEPVVTVTPVDEQQLTSSEKKDPQDLETLTMRAELDKMPKRMKGPAGGASKPEREVTTTKQKETETGVEIASAVSESMVPPVQMQEKYGVDIQKIVANKYLLDFGNVRLGFAKKITMRASTGGYLPVTFKVDKSYAKGLGFAIEPDRVVNLPAGHSVPQTTEIRITFNTSGPKFPVGRLECWVPINVKEGPMTMMLLTANVTAPDLYPSTDLLDFGTVQVGRCKNLFIRLVNKGEAPCEWCSERPDPKAVTMKVLKDWEAFTCTPENGIIPPYDETLVKVLFTPKLQKLKNIYETVMSIRVTNVPNPYVVNLKGKGYLTQFIFEPSFIEVGPIVPNADVPARTKVQLINQSNHSIEVYSLDFDPQYIQEEEILRDVKTYNEKQILYTDIREAGDPFWKSLIPEKSSSPKAKDSKTSKDSKVTPDKDKTNDGKAQRRYPIDGPVVIIFGPPLIGKTTQIKGISNNFRIPVVDLEHLMLTAVRDKKLVFPGKAKNRDEGVDQMDGKPTKDGQKKDNENKKSTQKGAKKEKGKLADDTKGGKKEKEDKKAKPVKRNFEADLLNVLRTRIQNPDCSAGVAFDGLRSNYLPSTTLIESILQVLGLQSSVVNVPVKEDEAVGHGVLQPNEHKQGLESKETKELKGKADEGKSSPRKTTPKNIWKGGPQVHFVLLKAEPPELNTHLEKVSEVCHSVLKSKLADDEEEVEAPRRLCQHRLHFPALEGGEPYRTEIASHMHLDKPALYPYRSVFPSPEEVEKYFAVETELIKLLGGPTTRAEAEKVGQCVILSPIRALAEVVSVLDQVMSVLPTPPSNLPVPEPVTLQVIKKPQLRELTDVTEIPYTIITAKPSSETEAVPGSPKGDQKSNLAPKEKEKHTSAPAAAKKAANTVKSSGQKNPLEMVPAGYEKKARWIIPPRSVIDLAIQFWTSEVGEFDHAFQFELMGSSGYGATLDCTGVAAYPEVSLYYMKYPPRRQNPNLIGVKEKRIPQLIPVSEAKLDFGAINTGPPPREYPGLPDGEHCKKLSVCNTGLFDLHVDYELVMDIGQPIPGTTIAGGQTDKAAKKPPLTDKKGPKGDKKDGRKGDSNQAVYSVYPTSMDLLINQSSVLSLFCYPKEGLAGKLSARLLCKIKNKPEPTEFVVNCIAETPRIDLSSNLLDFQRVLIGKMRQEELVIKNLSGLKVKWVISGIEHIPPTFSVSKSSSGVKAGEEAIISFAFKPEAEAKLEQKLTIQVTHGREDTKVAQEHPLRLVAEGYFIEVTVTFPDPQLADEIDFGTVKVAEPAVRPLLMENKGKYPVKYKFNLNSQLIVELFNVSSMEGILPPKGKLKVDMQFNKEKKLEKETYLQRNCDITLDLIEPLYERTEKTIPIFISLHAVHTKFLILPAREIDFEYQVCGLLSEARTMKILNTGIFELEYKLTAAPSTRPDARPVEKEVSVKTKKTNKTNVSSDPERSKSGKGKKGNVKAAPKMLDLKGFQLFPAAGTVPAGAKQDISVYCKAPEYPTNVCEEIRIAIKGKDPLKYPEDISYDLKGESQFPGFRTDPEVIFEEHRIVDNFATFESSLPLRTYSKDDHIYSFGAVFIDTDMSASGLKESSEKPTGKAPGEIRAVKEVRVNRKKGADVNLKIDNPYKVPCTVEFSLTPEIVEQETLEPYESPFAMLIQPPKIDVPPLECRYIQCLFNPISIRTYAAIFEAVVKNGGDDVKTKQFRCHLRGDGTLPHVQVESPTETSTSGLPWLKYPRTKVNQSFTLPIVLNNSGIVPATVNILAGGGCHRWLQMSLQTDELLYNVLPFSSNFKVQSKRQETILVTFTPMELRQYECEIQLNVSSNPFDNISILISGEGYLDTIECLGLPKHLSDEIWFEDGPYGTTQTIAFTMINNCDKDWRFTWPSVPSLSFSPATGHLHAKSTKAMIVVFTPNEMTEYVDKEIRVPMYNILFQEPRPLTQWDSPVSDMAMLEADRIAVDKDQQSLAKGKMQNKKKDADVKKGGKVEKTAQKTEGGKKGPKLEVAKELPVGLNFPPEPPHEVLQDTNKTMVLKLHAVADRICYECNTQTIHFKSTMMFQSRTFCFNFKSLSRARLVFTWQMYTQDGQLDNSFLYSVEPQSGSLSAESTTTIIVKFSPTEIEDCTRNLRCKIQGLDPQWMPLSIPVTGHVTRPWCHFKLPKSDYISAKRRSQALVGPDGEVGPLHPDTKVIEIKSLGINVPNFLTFTAFNPTSKIYKFVWEAVMTPSQTWREDQPPLRSALEQLELPFRCLCNVGEINPGEGYEMNFEFCPVRYDLQERFWTFRIPALDIAVPFLLVGSVEKPKLHFDHAVVNFGKVQVGTKGRSRIMLVNCEDIAFPFAFDKTTYIRTHHEQNPLDPILLFLPSNGTVAANSETPIDIKFMPMGEGHQNFNVICNLKKSLQLTVNVKGEGYSIHDKVFLEMLNDGTPSQLSPKDVTHIDLGEVLVNNMVFKRFQLTNTGIFPFQYVWMLDGHKEVVVEPPGGTVEPSEQQFCDLSFCPVSPGLVANVTVTCQIRHSNSYVLNFSGTAYRPKADFSFLDYDFGPTFLDAPEREPPIAGLVVTNAGMSSITCENLYESTPQLDVPHTTLLIPEGERESIYITFKPQEARAYKELVKFSINGLDIVTVVIKGEGVKIDVQLKDPDQKHIYFDSLKIGQFAKIPVQLVNKSKASCQLSWTPLKVRFLQLDMVCLPAEGLLLQGKATGTVDIQFRPKSRIAPFNEPFIVAAANTEIMLGTVSGACTGTEVKLSVNRLAFATVTLGSKVMRKIQIENCGDIGTAFAWDVFAYATECTFFPPEGYLAPHQVATVEVSFHPTTVHPDILLDRIRCAITGGEPQFLSLTGACIEHDPPMETLKFIAPVRSTDTKTLQIKNPTERPWMLNPKIENKFFYGPGTIEVQPNGTVGYNITFCPLTMSKGSPHLGSITLPMPDGSALYYKLTGDAGAPLPEGDITFDVMARRKASIPLQLKNWLKLSQVFKVLIERHMEDVTATLTGPNAVDLPGHAIRECLLQFHAYRPGTYGYKVTFLNERTGEYMFYNLMLVLSKGDIVKIIPFEGVARQRMVHTLHIKNPLQTRITFTVTCENYDIRVPNTLEIDPAAVAAIDIVYRPLLEAQGLSYLVLKNELLGEMVYQLDLVCHAGGFDDTLHFMAPLGGRQTQSFRFMHYMPAKVNYKCEMSQDEQETGFIVPPTAAATNADLDGKEVEVPVIFEPSAVGERYFGVLYVQDPKAGNYSCRLVGTCVAPVPQGPVIVGGKGGSINFRNVFDSAIQFNYAVDNPSFTCGKGDKIGSKKQIKVPVSFKPNPGCSDRGRLTITSEMMPVQRWIFYLQGIVESESKSSKEGKGGRPGSPPKGKK